jgi:hypothetical protein
MGSVSDQLAAIQGSIGKCPLGRKEDPIAAVVPMAERAANFMDIDEGCLPNIVGRAAVFSELVLPVERNWCLGDRGAVRLGSYLLHSGVFLSFAVQAVSDPLPMCETLMAPTWEK